jgi:ABC-type multidrug transport system ATPase subunit
MSESTAGPALAAECLTRRFGARTAVDNVGFTVAAGEVFGLLGPKGAGKSTTARLLTGFDEPTAGLDVASVRSIREVIAGLNRERGTTVFLTTHNMEEAEQLCHRVAIIDGGRLAAIDTLAALRARVAARRSVIVTFAGAVPEPGDLLPRPGMEVQRLVDGWRVYGTEPGPLPQAIAVRSADLGIRLESIATQAPSLQEVFVFITGRHHGHGD